MGIDARPLGNHKLNTSSIAALAADLSAICDAEVTYGYQDSNGADPTFGFVTLGIAGPGKKRLLKLYQNDYNPLTSSHDGEELVYECFEFDDGAGCDTSIFIYKDCFEPPAYFTGRWTWFQKTFTGEHDGWEYMFEYRRKLRDDIRLFGGDTAIIYADGSDINAVGNDLFTLPFREILAKVKANPGFLDIPAWLGDNNAPFMNDPLVFHDDFSVWPTVEQMTERTRSAR